MYACVSVCVLSLVLNCDMELQHNVMEVILAMLGGSRFFGIVDRTIGQFLTVKLLQESSMVPFVTVADG